LDQAARKTYKSNSQKFSRALFESGNFAGGITQINKNHIPDFDSLTAGFPGQTFSQAGHKNGFSDIRLI